MKFLSDRKMAFPIRNIEILDFLTLRLSRAKKKAQDKELEIQHCLRLNVFYMSPTKAFLGRSPTFRDSEGDYTYSQANIC